MDPVSNVDRLVLLLRQRLQERERLKTAPRAAGRKAERTGGLTAAQALAAIDDVDEHQFRRALIQGLLTDQFGQEMLNEARFQQVVDRVVSAIESDAIGRGLLDRISREIRTGG